MLPVIKPTVVIDKEICLDNIARMAARASRHNLSFKPHFKTHQSATIGNWFRDFGVRSITVSSVFMASYFAQNGWDDITIAFPVNVLEIREINELAAKIRLNLLTDNLAALNFLEKNLTSPVGVYIELDTGLHRSGIDVKNISKIELVVSHFKNFKNLHFIGFHSHSGQNYATRSVDEIHTRHNKVLKSLQVLKDDLFARWPNLVMSIGDTPACSISENFKEIDEIRPGNFVFYDLMQEKLGACKRSEIAAKVVCPVVSSHQTRHEFVIYGGAVHLSKEYIANPVTGTNYYGAVGACSLETGILASDETCVAGLSQEHGVIRAAKADVGNFRIGSLTEIIPVHSCLAADLAGYYLTTRGERIEKIGRMM